MNLWKFKYDTTNQSGLTFESWLQQHLKVLDNCGRSRQVHKYFW